MKVTLFEAEREKNKSKEFSTAHTLTSLERINSKEMINAYYLEFIRRLDDGIKKISSIKPKNKKFETIQKECLNSIKNLLQESKLQMEDVMNGTIWDKLVIAFFGETNAGKSTIIEAFRAKFNDPNRIEAIKKNGGKGVDGLIVGDGRPDFTQIYEKYNLTIEGRPFVLIDVPGIEGKEKNYLKDIGSALKQAHCIFYVQGHNKKPDAATAEKIKAFLSDWVNVYSIYNVRGSAADYDEDEERENLFNANVKKTQDSIEKVFNQALPNVYKGNITCQGLLALISVADFHESRQDLINNQKKILSYFIKLKNVEVFSNFAEITDLVKSQSIDYFNNIIEANKQKLLSLSKKIYDAINETINRQHDILNALTEQLNSFRTNVSQIRGSSLSSLKNRLHSELMEVMTDLKNSANQVIDENDNKTDWMQGFEYEFGKISKEFKSSVKNIISESVKSFQKNTETKRKDLDKIQFSKVNVSVPKIDFDIDFNSVISNLSFNLWSVIGGLLEGHLKPWRLLKKSKDNDGRIKAKRKISEKLNLKERYVKDKLDTIFNKVQKALVSNERKIKTSIEKEKKNIESLQQDLYKLRNIFKR